jgi:hypothetical protein
LSQIIKSIASGPIPPAIPTEFVTDDGTVIPALNIVNVNGDTGVKVIADPDGSNNMLIQLTGSTPNYRIVTGPTTYEVLDTDYFISCDSTAGIVTVQLPDSPTDDFEQFVIKDRLGTATTNNIIVTTVSGLVLIDGTTSQTFSDDYESLEVIWNGTFYESF